MIVIKDHHIGYSPHGCTHNELVELDRHVATGELMVSPACAAEVRNGDQITMEIAVGRGDWQKAIKSHEYYRFDLLSSARAGCVGRCLQVDDTLAGPSARGVCLKSSTHRYVRSASTAIPQELFSRILEYVSAADSIENRQDDEQQPDFCRHTSGQHDWRNFSLVCVYWANQCRRYLFLGVPCHIDMATRMDLLRRTMAWEGQRDTYGRLQWLDNLVTISGIIVSVRQEWKSGSWNQHVSPLPLKDAAYRLELDGSTMPADLPASVYRSPHWNLPRTLPSSFIPYHVVELRHIHFSSFRDFCKLLSHFKSARNFFFDALQWDSDASLEPQRYFPSSGLSNYNYQSPKSVRIDAENCTDNVLACFQACQFYDGLTIRYFDDVLSNSFESQLLTTLKTESFSHCSAEWDGIQVGHAFGRQLRLYFSTRSLTFILGFTLIFNPKMWATPYEMAGISVRVERELDGWSDSHAADLRSAFDLKAFWAILDNIPMESQLAAVLVTSSEYDVLTHVLDEHPCLRKPSPSVIVHRFACKSGWENQDAGVKGDDWVHIDPKTTQALGETWESEKSMVVSSLLASLPTPEVLADDY
ncbi:hypothetical protein BC835DRAFT_855925 [Cytidiella melzeri]|nr:hypothetical protein BC835DRAFT_855925 [Cytidiella melzeri]